MNKTFWFFCVFFAAILSGCMFVSASVDTGNLLAEERVSQVRRGETTRTELLNMFGPPVVVLNEGERTKTSLSNEAKELNYEVAFLLFAEKFQPESKNVIFYYENTSASNSGVVVVLTAKSKTTINRNRLWVLLDDDRGVVLDYVLRND